MAFKKPQINKVKTEIQSALIYLRATKKFGKTTLFRDIVLEKFGSADKGLLIGVGHEQGYTLLDNLNVTQVESWTDLIDLKKYLISEKGKDHNIEYLGFDVVGEMIPMVQDEVIKLSVKETGKPCKTFNSAYGGFNAPRDKSKDLLKTFFTELKKAGFGIFAIEHTKTKSIKEKGDDGEGYSVLTSTLSNDYEAVFGDIFDFVLTGYVDKTIENGKLVGSTRKLFFRGDGYVDAGGRFANGSVPEYIVFDESNMAEQVIEVIEEGMRKSATKPVSKSEFKKLQKEEVQERQKQSEEFIKEQTSIDVSKNNEYIEQIKKNIGSIDVGKMQSIMSENEVKDFSEPSKIKTSVLEEIIALIK